MLVNGKWVADWQPVQKADEKGRFVRQTSSFRNWITPDGAPGPTGEGGFKAEAGRYRLYVALICPWASRTLIARELKGLADLIPVTAVNPRLSPQGWQFGGYPGADAGDHERHTRVLARDQPTLRADAVDPPGVGRAVDDLGLVEQVEDERLVRRPTLDDDGRLAHGTTKPGQRLVHAILQRPKTELKREVGHHDPHTVLHIVKRLFGLKETA